MYAARQRAGGVARQVQRAARTYASDAHHKTPEANESFGKGSIATVATFIAGALVYQFVPKEGEESYITKTLESWRSKNEDWEALTQTHTAAVRQAGFDRNLFENGGNGQRFVDVAYPEALQSHAHRNVRAGHILKIDHVVEHYRQQHLKEEELKAKKLAERKE